MKINHAILHVFDFVSCVNVFAEEELDLSSKNAKGFVTKRARQALSSIENKHGVFKEESGFAEELREYFCGRRDFVDLSVQIAQFVAEELGRTEKAESTDVLVVDFEDDAETDVSEIDDEAALNDAYRGRGRRYFALFVLESRQAYMHEVVHGDGGVVRNDIARHRAVLPNPSQKLSSYALVDARTMEVAFVDKEREIAGEKRYLIPQGLLQCTMEASSKEVIDTVVRIVEEVAEEYGANSAVALSKAKAYVSESAGEFEEIVPEEMAREVFGEDSPMQKRFEEAAAEESLPERVTVEKAASRVAKNHKIRTDTGIEITFPAEYGRNPDFIEFSSLPDGTISIELKNIGHIENR